MKTDEIGNPGCSWSKHLLCYLYVLQGPTVYVCCLVRKKENAATKPAKLVKWSGLLLLSEQTGYNWSCRKDGSCE